jgi:hypothetical protein
MMTRSGQTHTPPRLILIVFGIFMLIGLGTFIFQAAGPHPERAWEAYLVNFLFWSAIAQGGLLFSVVMHLTRARWSQPMQNLAESFGAFFPLSMGLFLILFLGKDYLFPWLHHDFHGQKSWLNLPFLFTRDVIGLLLLYGLGLAYLYYALRVKIDPGQFQGRLRAVLLRGRTGSEREIQRYKGRMTVLGVLYVLFYALVLTLLAFDLIMSMEPPWYSTLFGAYAFAKGFYVGLAALMILSAIVHLSRNGQSGLSPSHFHDLGKLLFAFCLVWADFFYVQLLIIWYGNLPEDAGYVIHRTVIHPWNLLAWAVFIVCFVIPFFILLNQRVKTRPVMMIGLCSVIMAGLWFEHLLLVGPALSPQAQTLSLGMTEGLITLGFFGLLALAVTLFLRLFPDLIPGAMGS